jgi:hypothetical protein
LTHDFLQLSCVFLFLFLALVQKASLHDLMFVEELFDLLLVAVKDVYALSVKL